MDIPIELFGIMLASAFGLIIVGLLRQPQIPATIAFGGMFILFIAVTTDQIIMGYFQEANTSNIVYSVNSRSGSINIFSSTPIHSELAVDSSSAIYNQQINCAQWMLRKTGSPPLSSIITFGVWDSSANLKYTFGTMNVTALTTASKAFEICNSNFVTPYIITSGDRIGVRYIGGNSTNAVSIDVDSNNPFDGVNTVASTWNGASWTQTTGQDLQGIMRYFNPNSTNGQFTFAFTEMPKVIFSLLGVIFMLVGAIMVMKTD